MNNPEKIKADKVMEALNYTKKRYEHYSELEAKLISLLPIDVREEYMSQRTRELMEYANKLNSCSR